MIFKLPNAYYLVCGKGVGSTKLNAFDHAIMEAKVGDTNLVRMSSILPPGANKIKPIVLPYGHLVPIAYSFLTTDKNIEISASIGVGINRDSDKPGLIMEYSDFKNKKSVELKVSEMVKEGFEFRGSVLKDIETIAISYRKTESEKFACVFAGLVLWSVN